MSQGNITPSEQRYLTTASPGYCNTTEAQENDLKPNLKKMIDDFKEEIKSLKKWLGSQGGTHVNESVRAPPSWSTEERGHTLNMRHCLMVWSPELRRRKEQVN